MATLRVFDSEGTQIHPPDAEESVARYSNYFGAVHLVADFGAERPYVECYARVRTERRKEQVFVRFDGEEPERLLADCRSRVRSELVEGRGWTFAERTQVDPSMLFGSLVRRPDPPASRSLAGTALADRESTVESLLADGTDQLRVHGRNFGILAGLVETYRHTGCSVAVVDGPDVDASADLLLVEADIVDAVEVPRSTVEAIDRYERRLARERRERQFDRLEEALAELDGEGADGETVARELRRRTAQYFPGVEVLGPGDRRPQAGQPFSGDGPSTDSPSAALGDGVTNGGTPSLALDRRVSEFRSSMSDADRVRAVVIGVAVLLLVAAAVALFTGVSVDTLIPDSVNWLPTVAATTAVIAPLSRRPIATRRVPDRTELTAD